MLKRLGHRRSHPRLRGGPLVRHGLMMFLGRALLTLIRPRWIQDIAPWWRRACRVVRIGLRHIRGRQSLTRTWHLECSFIIPGFWSLSGRRSQPGFCTIPRRFGFNAWARRMLWQLLLICHGTLVSCYQTYRFCRNLLRRCTECLLK